MGLDPILSYGITLLGALLCVFSMVFIFLGKKIAGGPGTPQIVKFRGVEVQTNSVLLLFIVSVLVATLPLLLLHYRPLPAPPVATAPVPEKFFIIGYVHQPDGNPLEGARVQVSKLAQDGASQSVSEQTADSDGSFATELVLGEGDRLKVTTTKDGYINQTLILSKDTLNYPTVLVHKAQ